MAALIHGKTDTDNNYLGHKSTLLSVIDYEIATDIQDAVTFQTSMMRILENIIF